MLTTKRGKGQRLIPLEELRTDEWTDTEPEEMEKVNADLVVRDSAGRPQTVRYEQINAMLLNEFLKEHRTVQELKSEIAALTATVKAQSAQIQKVSASWNSTNLPPGRCLTTDNTTEDGNGNDSNGLTAHKEIS